MANAAASAAFVVIYRSGGTDWCRWTRILEAYASREAASAKADELARQGYKALVHTFLFVSTIGLPIGWSVSSLDEDVDTVLVERDANGVMLQTTHIKAR